MRDGLGEYATEDAAFAAVERIKAQTGCWPGVIRRRDDTFDIKFKPDSADSRRDYGYAAGTA